MRHAINLVKVFISINFSDEIKSELLMDGWEKKNLERDHVVVFICSVSVLFSLVGTDIHPHWSWRLLTDVCLIFTAARCNSCCFWSFGFRGISLTLGKISAGMSEHFPSLSHPWECRADAFLSKRELYWLKLTLDIYSLI